MKPITTEQAAKLRSVRKPAYGLRESLQKMTGEIACVRCPHEDAGIEHDPKICRYCRVYSACTSALDGLDRLTDTIDAALQHGPRPT